MMIKRMFPILLVAVFGFMLAVPVKAEQVTYDNAYKAIVQVKTYTIDSIGGLALLGTGSGVIIDANGLVLTNYHVIGVENPYDDSVRSASYQICLTSDPNIEPDCSYLGRVIASDKDQDLALLKIYGVPGLASKTSYDFLPVSSDTSALVNSTVRALGYPAIGGETLSISEGIISGRVSKYGKNWLKTDAITSFGSSGGCLIDENGKVVGITTQAYADLLGSLGYAITADSISSWLSTNSGGSPKTGSLDSRLSALSSLQKSLKNKATFEHTDPPFSITKPDGWEFTVSSESGFSFDDPSDPDGGFVDVSTMPLPYKINYDDLMTVVDVENASQGVIGLIDVSDKGLVTMGNTKAKKFHITLFGESADDYMIIHGNYIIEVQYKYGKDDKDKVVIDKALSSLNVYGDASLKTGLSSYHHLSPEYSFVLSSGWAIQERVDKSKPIRAFNHTYPGALIESDLERIAEDNRYLSNEEYLDRWKLLFEQANQVGSSIDLQFKVIDENAHVKLNDEISDAMMLEIELAKSSTGESMVHSVIYFVKTGSAYISVDLSVYNNRSNLSTVKSDFVNSMTSFRLGDFTEEPPQSAEPETAKNQTPSLTSDEWTTAEAALVAVIDSGLIKRLAGKILLQVDEHGEAWYIDPKTLKKYYMKDGPTAYEMMRRFGLGITDADLAKIPVEGSNVAGDKQLVNQLRGKILLQVEQHGEAWYVNPADGKRYYLKDGAEAYRIMRILSLGISNKDLRKISVGSIGDI